MCLTLHTPTHPHVIQVVVELNLSRYDPTGPPPSLGSASCDDLAQAIQSPYLTRAGPLWLAWYTHCIYAPIADAANRGDTAKVKKARYVVWKRTPGHTAGFGNQVRSLISAFAFATMTRRVFVIRDDFFFYYFDSPPGLDVSEKLYVVAPLCIGAMLCSKHSTMVCFLVFC